MSGDLAAFLAARLDEDEAAANAAASVAGPGWKAGTYWPEDESRTRTCVRSEDGAFLADLHDTPDCPDLAAHIARHDPARALREVAAKRAIVRWHPSEPMRNIDAGRIGRCPQCELTWPCPTIRVIAAVYSDHPDYRQEWKP